MVCIKAIAFVVVVVAVGLLATVGESRAARKDLGINLGGLGIGIGLGAGSALVIQAQVLVRARDQAQVLVLQARVPGQTRDLGV